jgi:HSP20 family protein
MAQKPAEVARQAETVISRRDPSWSTRSPYNMLERFTDEMDRLFNDFGLGRGWMAPRLGSDWLRRQPLEEWVPAIEVLQRNNELLIRADLPGLTKDDLEVDITDDAVTIQGARTREHQEEHEGVYRSERSYGSFYRVLALPEHTMTDQAKATFKDGVLEITMPAPPETTRRGRRLEVSDRK